MAMRVVHQQSGRERIVIPWTSDGAGAFSEVLDVVFGALVRVVFIPGAGGSQPTDLYDVTLTDEHGVNVLSGQGANLSNAAASNVCPGVPLKDGATTSVAPQQVHGQLTLAVANAGNAKSGTVVLYLSL